MQPSEPTEPSEPSEPDQEAAYARSKRRYVLAAAGIAGGLAIAGTLDRTTGGVVLLAGWLGAIAALHRLGRDGSVRRP